MGTHSLTRETTALDNTAVNFSKEKHILQGFIPNRFIFSSLPNDVTMDVFSDLEKQAASSSHPGNQVYEDTRSCRCRRIKTKQSYTIWKMAKKQSRRLSQRKMSCLTIGI
jgi:hypothetical protein